MLCVPMHIPVADGFGLTCEKGQKMASEAVILGWLQCLLQCKRAIICSGNSA